MTKTEKNKRVVESFLNEKFKGCSVVIENKEYNQSNGFYLKEKHYHLCGTQILYQWERPDGFKIAFDYEFFRELEKWVPVRGKRQIFRDWLFNEKFPEFEYKNLLDKKFSYYK
jgi:hypothetical protein